MKRPSASPTDARALVRLFDAEFARTEDTVLRGGAGEPLYTPGDAQSPAVIAFRADYASSALHEVAHWCIAGTARRQRVDYGYWYAPDGRDAKQQRQFLDVEARPQALEQIFSRCCGLPFRVSMDNLDAPPDAEAERAFTSRVEAEVRHFCDHGLPERAQRFVDALRREFAPEIAVVGAGCG